MARRVFFSFHYARDSWRVSQVRNSWLTQRDAGASTFLDKAEWEAVERRGKQAVKNWIDSQMNGTSVTVVLIGRETAGREWVHYEISKSYQDGKGLLGIYIHNVQNQQRQTDFQGSNPFDQLYVTDNGVQRPLSSYYRTYDWVLNNGYANLANWIEAAARDAGR
jgi:hypothetical protein